jgi:transcriptional regulator with XRE-family HTH domain
MRMKLINEFIGENLKRIRKARKLSQAVVAERLGVEVPSVSRWETGTNRPSQQHLSQLCAIYGVTEEDLLKIPEQSEMKSEVTEEIRSMVRKIMKEEQSEDAACSDDEKQLLRLARLLSGNDFQLLIRLARGLAGEPPPNNHQVGIVKRFR